MFLIDPLKCQLPSIALGKLRGKEALVATYSERHFE